MERTLAIGGDEVGTVPNTMPFGKMEAAARRASRSAAYVRYRTLPAK
jgi:hypothetical protein